MAVRPRSRDLSGEQRRALEILGGSPHGCTEETLRAHGFTVRLLAGIVRAGFTVAKPEIVKAGGRTLSMLRLAITDVGRQALAGVPAGSTAVALPEPSNAPPDQQQDGEDCSS